MQFIVSTIPLSDCSRNLSSFLCQSEAPRWVAFHFTSTSLAQRTGPPSPCELHYLCGSRDSCLQASLSWHSGSNVLTFLPSCEPSLTSGIKLVDIMAATRAFTGPLAQMAFQVSAHCSPTPWFPVTSSANLVHQNHQLFLSHQHCLSHRPISFHLALTIQVTPPHNPNLNHHSLTHIDHAVLRQEPRFHTSPRQLLHARQHGPRYRFGKSRLSTRVTFESR
jgi:hypothetical protein